MAKTPEHELKCKDRVRPHFESRIEAIAAMLKAESEGVDEDDETYGPAE